MVTFASATQVAAVREAEGYTTAILGELGIRNDSPTSLNAAAFSGADGTGRPLASLFDLALEKVEAEVDRLTEQYMRELDIEITRAAMRSVEPWLDGVAQTLVADANRAGEITAMAQRPWLTGFVRAAEPGACSRCIILSGKFYLFSDGFLRHPRCRCSHIPAPDSRTPEGKEALDRLLEVESPYRLFESLSREEQDKRFTEAGAEAIRLGADIDQVVNARRGMAKAQFGGRDVLATTEGMTRRGVARWRMQAESGRRRGLVRLMPETLMAMAGDDVNERVRLLEAHGYIGKTPTLGSGGGSSGPPAARPVAPDPGDPIEKKARELLARARDVEPEVSSTVRDAAERNGAELHRFESRLKTEESLARKLRTEAEETGEDLDVIAGNLKDVLRYTAVAPEASYWSTADAIVEALESEGYTTIKRPTGWDRAGYRGLNLAFRAPGGQQFEVQIHTRASLEAAEAAHLMYEERRLPTTLAARRAELDRHMAAVFEAVPMPFPPRWK